MQKKNPVCNYDIKTPEERSYNMSMIRCTNTKPEMYIRSLLHRAGLRYRANYSTIIGKPDLFFTKRRVAVFIHGCYWHRHKDCRYASLPKTNAEFWLKKLEGNRIHDEKVASELILQGIRVLIIWECTIRKMKKDSEQERKVVDSIRDFVLMSSECFLQL